MPPAPRPGCASPAAPTRSSATSSASGCWVCRKTRRRRTHRVPRMTQTTIGQNQEVLLDSPVEGVTRIQLNRPDKLNAMSVALVQGLHDALDQVAADRDCRVIVLTGVGRGFCAGLDLN